MLFHWWVIVEFTGISWLWLLSQLARPAAKMILAGISPYPSIIWRGRHCCYSGHVSQRKIRNICKRDDIEGEMNKGFWRGTWRKAGPGEAVRQSLVTAGTQKLVHWARRGVFWNLSLCEVYFKAGFCLQGGLPTPKRCSISRGWRFQWTMWMAGELVMAACHSLLNLGGDSVPS